MAFKNNLEQNNNNMDLQIFECKSWMGQANIKSLLQDWKRTLLDNNLPGLVPGFPEKRIIDRCYADTTAKTVPHDISNAWGASIAIIECSIRTVGLIIRSENSNWDKLSQFDRHEAIQKVTRLLGVIWIDFGERKERSELLQILQGAEADFKMPAIKDALYDDDADQKNNDRLIGHKRNYDEMKQSFRKGKTVVEDFEDSIAVNKVLRKRIKTLESLKQGAEVDSSHQKHRIATLHQELKALYKTCDEKTAESAQSKDALEELTASNRKLQVDFDTKNQELSRKVEELTQATKKILHQDKETKLQNQAITRLRLVEQKYIAVEKITRG